MSYNKMMKWRKRNIKGIKQMYCGFNTSGITSEQIHSREQIFVSEMKQKTIDERKEYWRKASEIIALKLGSWHWEWCAFQRNFIGLNKEIL